MLALLDLIRRGIGIFSQVYRKDLMKLIFLLSVEVWDIYDTDVHDGNERVFGIYIYKY